jgi:ATP-dependent Lon protease
MEVIEVSGYVAEEKLAIAKVMKREFEMLDNEIFLCRTT